MGAVETATRSSAEGLGRGLRLLLSAAVLLALLLGGFAFWRFARAERRHALETWNVRLSAMADDRKAAIEVWLADAQSDAQVLLDFPTLRVILGENRPAEGEVPYPEKTGAAAHLDALLGRFAGAEGYLGIYLLDAGGRALASTPGAPLLPQDCRAWMADPEWRGVGARFFAAHDRGALIVHARPARSPGEAGGAPAVFLVRDPAHWLYPLLAREPAATMTGEVLLMRREGERVQFLAPLRFSASPLLSVTRPFEAPGLAARDALERREAFGEYRDYRDAPILAATRRIAGTKWGLVAKVDGEEALAPYRSRVVWTGVAWLLLLLLLGTALWTYARRQRMLHLEALSHRDERYRLLREEAGDPLLFLRPDGIILEANRAAEETYGYGPGQMAGLSVAQIRAPEERAQAPAQLQKALSGGAIFETLHLKRDGTAFPVEVRSRPARLGGQMLLVSTVRDVSERKRAEKALEESEARYRSTLDSMMEGCQIVGFDWRHLYVNPAAEVHNRRPKEEILGRTVTECWPGIEGTPVFHLERRCMEERTAHRSENEFVFPDGRAGWFRLSLLPVPEGMAIFSEDVTEGRRAQEAQRESEERLRQAHGRLRRFVDSNVIGVVLATPEGRILEANDYYLNLIGYTREEFEEGRVSWRSLTPPEWLPADEAALEELQRRGVCTPYEKEYWRRDGSRVAVLLSDALLPGPEPEIAAFVVDITERRRAEEALREERDFTAAVLDSLPGVVYCYDESFRFRRWNRDLERATGYGAGEIASMSPLDLFAEDQKGLLRDRIGEVFEKGASSVEADFLSKDGTRTPYYFTGVSASIEGRPHLVGVGIDLSERKRAEEEVLRLNARLEQLIAAVSALAGARDMAAVFKTVRKAARAMAGADGATVVLRDGEECHYVDENAISPLWKGRRFPLSACISGWSMLNRETVVIEDIYADPRIPVEAYRPTFVKSLAMVPIGRDAPVGAIGNYWARNHVPDAQELRLLETLAEAAAVTIHAVRAFEDLERKIQERTALLHAANQELEAFSYSVSHDLRAPLRGIDGFSLALAEDFGDKLGPEGEDYIRRIRAGAQRMAQLIEDLLTLSRVARAEMAREEVDLGALAAEVVRDLRRHGPERAVTVEIEPGLVARGDPRLLRLVLENLLGNAWKFTEKKVEARIRFGREGDGFVVQDDGAGFDSRYTGKLFAPFQRLHTASEFPGTGVGLAIVQRIVRRHGGEVWASGETNRGAQFGFTLGSEASRTVREDGPWNPA